MNEKLGGLANYLEKDEDTFVSTKYLFEMIAKLEERLLEAERKINQLATGGRKQPLI